MILKNPFKRQENRSIKSSDPYLAEFFGHTSRGYVDPERASNHAVAISARGVISQGLSSTPLKIYRKTDDGGREAATDHPLYNVLQHSFNPQLEAFHGREWLIDEVLKYGNAVAKIVHNGRGQVIALHPYPWREVTVERLNSGRLRYKIGSTNPEVLLQEEVLHLRYRTKDGIVGVSPIQQAREVFALALSQNDEATSLSQNAFRPSAIISFPNAIGLEKHSHIVNSFKKKFIGSTNAGEPVVIDGGAEVKTLSQTSRDAEFLESRKLSNMDVCRIYNVPPSTVGITDNATYSNIGEESRALVVRCLAPWAKRIEQTMNKVLLTEESRKRYFIEHDLSGLLRGDQAARYDAYRIGKEWGWLSTNEIRAFENLQSVKGGDEYLSPLNMRPSDEGLDVT